MPPEADQAEAELAGRDRVDLAIGRPGNHHLGGPVSRLGEGHHEVLAVPHGHDNREILFGTFVHALRLDHEPVGTVDQFQVNGHQSADAGQNPGLTAEAFYHLVWSPERAALP